MRVGVFNEERGMKPDLSQRKPHPKTGETELELVDYNCVFFF